MKWLTYPTSREEGFKDIPAIRQYDRIINQAQKKVKKIEKKADKHSYEGWVELPDLKAAWAKVRAEVMKPLPKDASTSMKLEFARLWQKYVVMSLLLLLLLCG